jgi:hypothetical protein
MMLSAFGVDHGAVSKGLLGQQRVSAKTVQRYAALPGNTRRMINGEAIADYSSIRAQAVMRGHRKLIALEKNPPKNNGVLSERPSW